MGIPDHLSCLLRNLYAGQEATELDMEQQTGSKLGKEYDKAVYCHPAYLTYMQSMSCEMPDWTKHKLELPGEMSRTSNMQRRRQWHSTPVLLLGKSHGRRSLVDCSLWCHTQLGNFTFTFHLHALEKETATHFSVLAWRIPGTGEPGGLLSMGSHRVGHD